MKCPYLNIEVLEVLIKRNFCQTYRILIFPLLGVLKEMQMHGTLYNYADDNTLSFSCPDLYRLTQVLQPESLILINWFHDNCMQANPDKFQTIAVGERISEKNLVLKIFDTEIKCKEVLKLLGVDIDYKINFDQHISNLCRKAGQQLNVLKRLSPFFSRD